jgi:hypothetical protein
MISLFSTIKGWSEIFQFKTGTSKANDADGTVTHSDFGAGVMFIPSGLGYYSLGTGVIPTYSPLVFSFKLYALERADQDNDVPSHQDIDGTVMLDFLATGVDNPDDTDKDGIPNYADVDDDGDSYGTKLKLIILQQGCLILSPIFKL